MDVGRILGGMLANRVHPGSVGGRILGQVLNGNAPPLRPPLPGQMPLDEMLRRAAAHHHAHVARRAPTPVPQVFPGGPAQFPPQYTQPCNPHDQTLYDQRAVLLIRAMINAAKSDGVIDAQEQQCIVGQLQPLSPAESQFLRNEFATPLNTVAFAASVPPGMEYDVYTVSLMAMRIDTSAEMRYLQDLARCLRLDPRAVHDIHQRMGVPCNFTW